jgi:hypothetical protein
LNLAEFQTQMLNEPATINPEIVEDYLKQVDQSKADQTASNPLTILICLISKLLKLKDFTKAEEVVDISLRWCRNAEKVDFTQRLSLIDLKVQILFHQNEFHKAQLICIELKELVRQQIGYTTPAMIDVLCKEALTLEATSDYETACDILEEAQRLAQTVLPPDDQLKNWLVDKITQVKVFRELFLKSHPTTMETELDEKALVISQENN